MPCEVAECLKEAGRDYVIAGIVGEAEAKIEDHPHFWLKWGEIGRMFKEFERRRVRYLICIGSISQRPNFQTIKLDFGAVKALPELLRILAMGGDESVLSGVAQFLEKRGLRLVSVRDVAPDLIVGPSLSVNSVLADAQSTDIAKAAEAAFMAGQLDIGQGVVVARGRILAMEGPEGTDQMLARVAELYKQKRAQWAQGKEGVLLKRARPGQDMRFDMPTIGPRTMEMVKAAGLAGVVCAQGEVLCASKTQTIQFAEQSGLFLQAQDLSHS
jgi:DUF1009 family protein